MYAKPINTFYEGVFNAWLNLHRPCLFATEVVSEKGKIIKRYKHKDVKTPLERWVLLNEQGLVTFKAGITLEDLLAQASGKTDLQAAQEMQQAKAELFELFKPTPAQTTGLKPVLSLSKGTTHQDTQSRVKTMRAGGLRRPGRGLHRKNSKQKPSPLNFHF